MTGRVAFLKEFNIRLVIIIGLGLLLLIWGVGCEGGLTTEEGIQGTVRFPVDTTTNKVDFPDSLAGAFVVVADFGLYTSIDSFFANIVGYSDPLDTTQQETEYYIQLFPGVYFAGIVGTTKSITEIYFMSLDSLAAHPEYFKPIGLYKLSGNDISSLLVRDDELTENVDIEIDYNLVLPF
jgi:hypothetical protein